MQIDVTSKSKSLLGITDLTLVATIKPGLIPALDTRTYETRLRILLKTLNTLRVSSLEVEPTPLIGDAVDRIRALHSFRLAIIGEDVQKRLLLSVAFDGGWEPYMRRIWRDLGPLLDIIFCNCEDYLDSFNHDYPAYAGWVRSAQVETQFFYNASSLTVNDLHYLRRKVSDDLDIKRDVVDDEAPIALATPEEEEKFLDQALPALTALYGLTDLYSPFGSTRDGDILLRAAMHLLGPRAGFLQSLDPKRGRNATERAALRWFSSAKLRAPPVSPKAEYDKSNVQGGIIEQYTGASHSCLVLVALKDAAAAREMLAYLEPQLTRTTVSGGTAGGAPSVNLAFTFQGLAIAGVPNGTLALLPFEFREGMAARASILGDRLYNHPSKWSLPKRNWPGNSGTDRVELASVHAIVQYTYATPDKGRSKVAGGDSPLAGAVGAFDKALSDKGVQILSVQDMQRHFGKDGDRTRGHFDFVDGISQPTFKAPEKNQVYSDTVAPGDLLLGYQNSLGDPALAGRLWDDSTFLVVRKLKQNVDVLQDVLNGSGSADDTKSKFMGRTGDGAILLDSVKNKNGNNFDYESDPNGDVCPFQSHVRRANPRTRADRNDLHTIPRIMRRGMSYGPVFDKTNANAERGLVFMAYNASIAEQFEVVQAWLSGGNSSDPNTYSALRDPFLGVPEEGDPKCFVFQDKHGQRNVVKLPDGKPIVKLEWGLYAFVPSLKAVAELKSIADQAAGIAEGADQRRRRMKDDARALRIAGEARKGEEFIAKLRLAEQYKGFNSAAELWKIALEDFSARMAGLSRVVWTAIRELHGGVLRTPYGVLVCSTKLVDEVFHDKAQSYTVTGYAERMKASFGEIYLGKDDNRLSDSAYQKESRAANDAIMSVTTQEGFNSAYKHAMGVLNEQVPPTGVIRLQVKDITDEILARISKEWFGLPDGKHVEAGGWDWRSKGPPTCPGHFHSPSRYMFQPNPGPEACLAGQQHGKLLKESVDAYFNAGNVPAGKIGNTIFKEYQEDQRASTLIGVMMGFLPTVDGNIRGLLYDWVSDRSLWDHQLAYLADQSGDPLKRAHQVLMPRLTQTLLLHPVPELVWRTALVPHTLGSVEIRPGDRIVVSIVSATQECLNNEDEGGLYYIFGGNRGETGHPTHACPAYKMAIGIMLGMLSGLLEFAQLRPTMSPLQLAVSRRDKPLAQSQMAAE